MAEVKVSKMTANRVTISRTVTSSLDVNTDMLAAALTALLFPQGVPESLTMKMVVQAFHDVLSDATKTLEGADLRLKEEQADDDGPRTQRDAAIETLRQRIIGTTEVMTSNYGAQVASAYGLGGDTPRDGDELLRKAETLTALLRKRPLTEPPIIHGVTVSPLKVADQVEGAADDLRQALEAVKRESREIETVLVERNKAVETWNDHYQGVATVLTGLYTLIGEDGLAKRVRPTRRRQEGFPEDEDLLNLLGEDGVEEETGETTAP